jgi:isopenicillin N synthase-like dioxygenase
VRNHGLDEVVGKHFDMSRKFFQLPVERKMEIITDENAKCGSGPLLLTVPPQHLSRL